MKREDPGNRLAGGGTVLVMCFGLVLLSAWFIGPPSGTSDRLQNTSERAFPALANPRSFLNVDTYIQTEAAIESRLRAKPAAVLAVNTVFLTLLGSSPSSSVSTGSLVLPPTSLGAQRELFFGGDFTQSCGTSQTAAAEGLAALESAARAGGMRVLFVVAPNKSTVLLKDESAWTHALLNCATASRISLQALATEHPSLHLVSPERVHQLDPAMPYWRGDTHWTPRTGVALTETVVDALFGASASSSVPTRFRAQSAFERRQDLDAMLGIETKVETPWWGPTGPEMPLLATGVDPLKDLIPFTTASPWPTAQSILVVGDSFTWVPELEGQVASYFPSGNFMLWDNVTTQHPLPGSRVLILESIERSALTRLAQLRPGSEYQALLNYLAAGGVSE